MIIEFFTNFLDLFQESAPWLLLGLLFAGMMKWLVPIDLLNKHMGKSDLSSIIKASLIGAPLPLCSCGVIPAAIGLRRAGASKAATSAFLVATPETGVDSISVSYALLGPFMAIIRPISAIVTAIYVGLLTMIFSDSDVNTKSLKDINANGKTVTDETSPTTQPNSQANSDCCSAQSPPPEKKSCCSQPQAIQQKRATLFELVMERSINILSFASGKLLEDITRWLLIGLLLAAAIKTWVATDFLTQWGDGILAMLVMALVGIPMYICATASTPIAAGFLAVGVSPGAVLVFMLAGPATNLSTMGMIRQEMGNSVLFAYLLGILTASIGFGYLSNWAITQYGFDVYQVAASHHQMGQSLLHQLAALLLAGLMLKNNLQWITLKKTTSVS